MRFDKFEYVTHPERMLRDMRKTTPSITFVSVLGYVDEQGIEHMHPVYTDIQRVRPIARNLKHAILRFLNEHPGKDISWCQYENPRIFNRLIQLEDGKETCSFTQFIDTKRASYTIIENHFKTCAKRSLNRRFGVASVKG